MIKYVRFKVTDFLFFIRRLLNSKKNENSLKGFKAFWRRIRLWVVLAFGLSLFLIIIRQISLEDFLEVFSNVNIGFLLLAFIVGLSATVFKTIRYGYFFPPKDRWLSLYGSFGIMRVLFYVLPFHSGEIVSLNLLKKYRFSPTITETAPTWLFMRITDVIAVSLWFTAALAFTPSTGILYGKLNTVRWIIIGISIGLIFLMMSLPFWISKISFGNSSNWMLNRLSLLKSGFERTFGLKVFLRTLINSIIIWGSLIAFYVLAQITFDTPLELWQCFVVSVSIWCFSLLPINAPLNIGTDEAAWTGIMVMAGMESNQAVSIALSIRIISMLVLLTDGLFGFIFLILKENRLKSEFQVNDFSIIENQASKNPIE